MTDPNWDHPDALREIHKREDFFLLGILLGVIAGALLGYLWKGLESRPLYPCDTSPHVIAHPGG